MYMFCIATLQKIESLQCSSVFATYMTMHTESEESSVDVFRVIYTDPQASSRVNVFNCKSNIICPTSAFFNSLVSCHRRASQCDGISLRSDQVVSKERLSDDGLDSFKHLVRGLLATP
jgi:hypothetical protein